MKLKSKVLYSAVCAMLFVMTFTTLTSVVAMGDIVNSKYIGKYNNTTNNNSFFRIRVDEGYGPIVAIILYDNQRGIYINGVGDSVGIDSKKFIANFEKVRKVDENGVIQGDWLKGSTIEGTVELDSSDILVTVRGADSVKHRTFKKE